MMISETWFLLLTFIFARVAGLVLTVPIFGTNDVPFRIRVLLALTLTLLVAPLQTHFSVQCDGTVEYLALLGCEGALGACLGLGVLVLIHGMTLAGGLIGQASGLGIAEVFDPAVGEDVPQFSRLLFLLAICVFLCIGGHRLVMSGLLDTFRVIPPGSGHFPATIGNAFTTLVSLSFSLGVRAAAPVVTSLLLATLILGMIARSLPQVSILAVGFGLNALLAFAALAIAISVAAWAFADQVLPAMETLFNALKTPLQTQWLK